MNSQNEMMRALKRAVLAGLRAWALSVGALLIAAAAGAQDYKVQRLVKGGEFLGAHGIAFDAEDRMHVGSVIGQSIHQVSPKGNAKPLVGPPAGEADGLAFAPDGTLVWAQPLQGKIMARRGGEAPRPLASGLPGVHAVGFDPKGRLFASRGAPGDALYEIDPGGRTPPRLVMEGLGGLGGFDFGRDGALYGPLQSKGQVVRIDVDKPAVSVLADGLSRPSAVRFDRRGSLYAVDSATGQVIRINPASGQKTLLSRTKSGLESLAFNARGDLFVTNLADNAIYRMDANSGREFRLVSSKLAVPGGLAAVTLDGMETLLVADIYGFRKIDLASGSAKDVLRIHADVLERPVNVNATSRHAYLSSWLSNTVERVDLRNGRALNVWRDFNAPMDAVDLPGRMFLVAEHGANRLTRVSGKEYETRETLAGDLGGPVALVAVEDRALVYVSEHAAGRIAAVSLKDGSRRTVVAGLKSPEGLALGADGRLYVAEVGERRVLAIDPDSGRRTVIAGGLPIGRSAGPEVPPPYVITGVAVGRDGAVFVSSDIDGAIYRLSKD